jgi:hypothetical protein
MYIYIFIFIMVKNCSNSVDIVLAMVNHVNPIFGLFPNIFLCENPSYNSLVLNRK